ncbi:MAG: hypothetical protein R2708_25015 [Vicinamibacterales bacterium]
MVIANGVGQIIGHCALLTDSRMRWPSANNTQDVKCISIATVMRSPGTIGRGSRSDLAVGAVQPGAGHQRHRAVRRDPTVREPVGHRGVGRHVEDGLGRPRTSVAAASGALS